MNRGPTVKQKAFVHAYVETMNPVKAYMEVYGTKGKTKEDSARLNAFKILRNAKVQDYLNSVRDEAANKAVTNLETHLRDLANIRELAVFKGDMGNAFKAERSRGEAIGLYNRDDTNLAPTINNYIQAPTPDESAESWADRNRDETQQLN